MNRDGYRDQIVTHDVGVSLHSKTHPLFMKYSNGTSTQCYAYHYPSLFPVLFLQSLYVPFLIQRIFHLLVQIGDCRKAQLTSMDAAMPAHTGDQSNINKVLIILESSVLP